MVQENDLLLPRRYEIQADRHNAPFDRAYRSSNARRFRSVRSAIAISTCIFCLAAMIFSSSRWRTSETKVNPGVAPMHSGDSSDSILHSELLNDQATPVGYNEDGTKMTSQGKIDQPNVVFVLVDDVGMNDMGPWSTDMAGVTPFLDSLMAQGVHLTNYYTNEVCTPARASLMTGRYPHLTGTQFVIEDGAPWGLQMSETTLGERFQAAGYRTYMVGKWHLGLYAEPLYPYNRGFHSFLGYLGGAETYSGHETCVLITDDPPKRCYKDFGYGDQDGYIDHHHNTTRMGNSFIGKYSTTIMAEEAINVVSRHQAHNSDDPFFLYLAFQAAHYPVNPPPDGSFSAAELELLDSLDIKDPSRAKMAHVMLFLDKEIGRIMSELDEIGAMDNTLLVFASDNGGCPESGGSNYPLRGLKHSLYQGGVHVPAFVYSKTLVPEQARGTAFDGLMHSVDWTPTIGHIARLPLASMGQPLSGIDQWKAIIGQLSAGEEAQLRRELVVGRSAYRFDSGTDEVVHQEPHGAFIRDGFKIIVNERCAGWFSFSEEDKIPIADCDNPYEYTSCTSIYGAVSNNRFLFDLNTDPYEERNLIDEMPELFDILKERWDTVCKDEVVSLMVPPEHSAEQAWAGMNNWVVAWRDEPVKDKEN